MKKSLIITTIFLLLSGFLMAQEIPEDLETEFLGETTVNFRGERDEIRVGLMDGFFRKIMIRVTENDVEIDRIVVVYGNGSRETIRVRHNFREGSRSRLIDLEGRRRVIRKVIFHYSTSGRLAEGRANLELYGVR